MNSPWQFNSILSFVDRPLAPPPFATGDPDIDAYLSAEIDQAQRGYLQAHAASSPLLARPLVVRSFLFVFFARLHAKIDALPNWEQKKPYTRELERSAAMLGELLKADLLLAPRQAEALFGQAMPTLIKSRCVERCVELAIKSRDGVDGAAFQRAMESIANGPLVEEFVTGYTYPSKSQLLETIEKANQAAGHPAGSHKISRSLAQARRDGEELMARLRAAAHPDLLLLIAQYQLKPGAYLDAKAVQLLVNDLAKGDPQHRGLLVDNVLDLQDVFAASPLFDGIWAAPRDSAFGLVNFDAMWSQLNMLPSLLSARSIRFSPRTAQHMLGGIKDYRVVLQEPQLDRRPESRKPLRKAIEIKTSVPLLKSLAASLPKGDRTLERQVRELPIADKYKNALLDGISGVERKGSLEAVQNEAMQALGVARANFGKGDIRPVATAGFGMQGRPTGITDRFRVLFGPKKETPRPAAAAPGPGRLSWQQFGALKPYCQAVLHGLCCDIDVSDDLRTILDLHRAELGKVNAQLRPDRPARTASDLHRIRESIKNYETENWLRELGDFCEAVEWATFLGELSPDLRQHLAELTGALLPTPDTSTPSADWLHRAGEAATGQTPELVELVLANYGASGHWGVLAQQDLVHALVWVSAQLSPDVAPGVGRFANHCLEDLPGQGARNKKLGNAALWALSEMRDGAGIGLLEKIVAGSPFPSVQQLARQYLNKSALKGGTDPIRAGEMAFPDCGLADGPLRMPLKQGAAVYSFQAPDRIVLEWEREAGKTSSLMPSSMHDADPEGVKAAKKRAVTLQGDIAAAADWMKKHYLADVRIPFADWTQRYLDHGTFGPLARNLVWRATGDGDSFSFMRKGDGFVGANGEPVSPQSSQIRLWHPLDADRAELADWHAFMMREQVSQPFPQVWRPFFRAETASEWLGQFEGRVVGQRAFGAAAKTYGWTAPSKSLSESGGDLAWWFDEATLVYAEMGIEAHGPQVNRVELNRIALGPLRFYRAELGAKPSARGLKKKKHIEPGAIDPRMLSEIVFSAMLMTDIAESAMQMPHEDYSWRQKDSLEPILAQFEERTSNAVATSRQRADLLKAWIAQLPQTGRDGPTQARVTIDGDWIGVAGKLNTYGMHMTTGRLRSEDKSKRVTISNEPDEPGDDTYIPHAGDPRLSKMLAYIEHLLKDDRPGQKKIRIG